MRYEVTQVVFVMALFLIEDCQTSMSGWVAFRRLHLS